MNKRKILKNIFMMILTSTMLIGNMSSLVKAENIDGSILAVKNTTPALQNILRENGEKELSSDEYKIIDSKDNKYVEEKSTDIPYVNFTIKIDDSVDDLSKVKVNKPQMINLIKAGAFDSFGDSRKDVMNKYIISISDQKKRVTLQNMKMLIDFNLLPDELDFEIRIFNFNKY